MQTSPGNNCIGITTFRRKMPELFQEESLKSTHFAYRVRRYSSETGEPAPRSPFRHFWVPGCCTPSFSTGYTLSHRPTTYSSLSTHHPLQSVKTSGEKLNEVRIRSSVMIKPAKVLVFINRPKKKQSTRQNKERRLGATIKVQ